MSRQDLVVKLIDLVRDGQLLAAGSLPSDADSALDARDEEPFESAWLECYQRLADDESLTSREVTLLKELGKQTFKTCYELFGSIQEITRDVADDLDLVARSILLDQVDSFANYLLACYLDGEFPTTPGSQNSPTASQMIQHAI
jgi:hypothetical protein